MDLQIHELQVRNIGLNKLHDQNLKFRNYVQLKSIS